MLISYTADVVLTYLIVASLNRRCTRIPEGTDMSTLVSEIGLLVCSVCAQQGVSPSHELVEEQVCTVLAR
jgi:hypothetical protein